MYIYLFFGYPWVYNYSYSLIIIWNPENKKNTLSMISGIKFEGWFLETKLFRSCQRIFIYFSSVGMGLVWKAHFSGRKTTPNSLLCCPFLLILTIRELLIDAGQILKPTWLSSKSHIPLYNQIPFTLSMKHTEIIVFYEVVMLALVIYMLLHWFWRFLIQL